MELECVFVIADLAGYTALTEAMGAEEAANVVDRYVVLASTALCAGTRLIERVGDQVLITAVDALSATRTALALREAVEAEPFFPSVRIGLHGGPVLERDGRYFGPALNLTARVAAHARAGQVLCTGWIAAAVTPCGVDCRPLGAVRFRNVAEPIDIFEIVDVSEEQTVTVLDPVCRMHVRRDSAPARLPFAGATYFFCSFECARPGHCLTARARSRYCTERDRADFSLVRAPSRLADRPRPCL